MLKIGVWIAIPLVVGFFIFPQFRVVIAGLAPFALFALCPLAMLFGMWGMKGKDDKNTCDGSCGHPHKEAKP